MSEEDILIALKEIHARYCIPACEQNYTDKDYACIQYEKLVINLKNQLQQKDNIIKDIKAQLDYLETYSSKEDVFEDMKRRLDRIKKIIEGE